MVPISVTSSSVTASTRRVSRSVTTAVPSGRKSRPHGASRPVAMVATTFGLRFAEARSSTPWETGSGRGWRCWPGSRVVPARSASPSSSDEQAARVEGESERQRGEPHALRL